MTPGEFAAKWRGVETSERASAQSHFLDLCALLGEPGPTAADPTGSWYAFEKGAEKLDGRNGFADVWKRGHFGWEYKGKRKDLKAAYRQLLDYKDALENPPLLVVSDLERIEVRTNFTSLSPKLYTITLDELASPDPSEALRILRAVFTDPEALRPHIDPAHLTEVAARRFAELAGTLQGRGYDPGRIAHFLDKLLFCLFAEDTGLLPKGLLSRLADATRYKPADFGAALGQLFATMADGGGMFGVERIEWFDGGLFDSADVLALTAPEIGMLIEVGRLDWSRIEPAIFGTLFERGLDPSQRAQLGAHYTSRDDIWRLVEPVVIRPLRREYEAMQAQVTELALRRDASGRKGPDPTARRAFEAFLERLRSVRVLDPACGSGNFLYIALRALKDLELETIQWGSLVLRLPQEFPRVGPEAVLGIEINGYAAELARVTIWIGEIQWMLDHGFHYRHDPILQPLQSIATKDALLDLSDTDPQEAEWPAAEFIVGNPPFLGNRLLRRSLGHAYTEALWAVYKGRLPPSSDLCCYWHEKARAQIVTGRARRAGMLATQAIRNDANRRVLGRINESGAIFYAYSSEPWVLAGAAVNISFIGQDDGSEQERTLNGVEVRSINDDLTTGLDLTRARRLAENHALGYYADVKAGPFEITPEIARRLIDSPNPDGRSNRDVVRPWVNASDITGRPRGLWIVDFGVDMPAEQAALYEAPFEWVRRHVYPIRMRTRRAAYRDRWWLHAEPVRGMRAALANLSRFVVTPAVSKHRLFAWLPRETLADHQVVVIAREDDYTFGVLQSRVHEAWALAIGPQLETRPRYPPMTTLETYPFPRPTAEQREATAAAARRLVELRNGWLNPPNLSDADLAKRTLTNLYNERPTWLANAHAELDRAVVSAYGLPDGLTDDELLRRLLELNLARDPA